MEPFLSPGDLVEINFSEEHRKHYPAYSARFQGKWARVVKCQAQKFVTVMVAGEWSDLCIESEFLILREVASVRPVRHLSGGRS